MNDTRFTDRGATLLWTVQHLPALQQLAIVHDTSDLGYDQLPRVSGDDNGLPWCEDLASLRSASLTQLIVSMLGGPPDGNTLRLSGLPELRSLNLAGEPDIPLSIRVDAASFRETPRLQSLQIQCDEALQLQPGSLAQLTGLTSLRLSRCDLQSMPADLASVGVSLRDLDLQGNDFQIDAAAVASILQCSQLSKLQLERAGIDDWADELDADPENDVWQAVQAQIDRKGYVPSRFSARSVKHLMNLPLTFYKLHRRELRVFVTHERDDV